MNLKFSIIALLILLSPTQAMLRPEKFQVADSRKVPRYTVDGVVIGGDAAIDQVVVDDIRFSQKEKYERIVVNLIGLKEGAPAPIARPPYFQVEVSPDQRRVMLSLWGRPQINFDPKIVQARLKKSYLIDKVDLLPKLEPEIWNFVIHLKSGHAVEIFELKSPVRIVMDIRRKSAKVID